MGLVAPRHVGSSRTRGRTCVPCIGRQILNHCTTREVLNGLLLTKVCFIQISLVYTNVFFHPGPRADPTFHWSSCGLRVLCVETVLTLALAVGGFEENWAGIL